MDARQQRARLAWRLISENPQITFRSLGNRLGCGSMYVQDAIDDLEGAGYVRRRAKGMHHGLQVLVPFRQLVHVRNVTDGKTAHNVHTGEGRL